MSDYTDLVGKKVTAKSNEGEEFEGTLEAASALGVVIKLKNSSKSHLIESKDLASVEEAATAPKRLKPRSLPAVAEGKVRQHLLDRHGYTITDVEAMTEDQAQAFHETIDHKGSDIGHFHREPAAVEAEIEAAESDQD